MIHRSDILAYIIAYKRRNDGNAPTLDEIGQQFHTTKSNVDYHLRRLEREGKIVLPGRGLKRQIQVVGGVWRMEGRA